MTLRADDVLPAHEARVLVALIRVYARDRRATVRAIAAEAGRSVGPTHRALVTLSHRGLVYGIYDGTQGAIRPAVVVA